MKISKEESVVKCSENKQIFLKSLFFMLSIYLIVNGLVFIGNEGLISTPMIFFALLLVFLIATPAYFFLKSNIKNFRRYLANMTIVHIVLFLVEFGIIFILDYMDFFKGWSALGWLAGCVFILAGIGIILLIDLVYNVYCLWRKKRKK